MMKDIVKIIPEIDQNGFFIYRLMHLISNNGQHWSKISKMKTLKLVTIHSNRKIELLNRPLLLSYLAPRNHLPLNYSLQILRPLIILFPTKPRILIINLGLEHFSISSKSTRFLRMKHGRHL